MVLTDVPDVAISMGTIPLWLKGKEQDIVGSYDPDLATRVGFAVQNLGYDDEKVEHLMKIIWDIYDIHIPAGMISSSTEQINDVSALLRTTLDKGEKVDEKLLEVANIIQDRLQAEAFNSYWGVLSNYNELIGERKGYYDALVIKVGDILGASGMAADQDIQELYDELTSQHNYVDILAPDEVNVARDELEVVQRTVKRFIELPAMADNRFHEFQQYLTSLETEVADLLEADRDVKNQVKDIRSIMSDLVLEKVFNMLFEDEGNIEVILDSYSDTDRELVASRMDFVKEMFHSLEKIEDKPELIRLYVVKQLLVDLDNKLKEIEGKAVAVIPEQEKALIVPPNKNIVPTEFAGKVPPEEIQNLPNAFQIHEGYISVLEKLPDLSYEAISELAEIRRRLEYSLRIAKMPDDIRLNYENLLERIKQLI